MADLCRIADRRSSKSEGGFRRAGEFRGQSLNSEIETADSADFTDFEEVIGEERPNRFVASASSHK
jgi:hypothetical protein